MSIQISEKMKSLIRSRQNEKFAAIRPEPIYDRITWIPVRNTKIRCLEFVPKKSTGSLPVVFDIHGGGFTNGYPVEDDLFCRMVCDKLNARVLSIDYRLAPECPFPEGQLDVYETIHYCVNHAEVFQIQPDKIVICGHSAGGNHALAAVMRAIKNDGFSPCGLVLDYPPLDLATPAEEKFYAPGCVPVELADLFNASYRRPSEARDPFCSPCFADDAIIRQLPPTTIITCEIDSLRDEAEDFAKRLIANGVEVTARRFLGQAHAFTVQYGNPNALEAIEMMIRSIGKYFHTPNKKRK